MKFVGPHVATTGGVFNAPLNAKAVGAKAFALFTKNQLQWSAEPYTAETIDSFHRNMQDCGFTPEQVLAHDSYLINIGNPDRTKRARSLASLVEELTRCSQLGLPTLNIHPGSHVGEAGETECLRLIAESINRALDRTDGVAVLLESTAGQGSNVGYRFEHLAEIIGQIDDASRVGACIDTCHIFAAGYDIRTRESYEATLAEFDKVVGFGTLRGLHLNDAKVELGSRVDRHQSIGKGTLGLDVFRFIMNDPRFDGIPMILETIDEDLWPKEIRMLYRMCGPAKPRTRPPRDKAPRRKKPS